MDHLTKRIVIIGGGPGGSSCALALAQAGYEQVTILEAGRYDRFRMGESVPPEIRPLLGRLGLMEGFLAQNHDPCYGSCSYWGDDRRGYNDSIMSPYGHGWHLNRQRFDRFLADGAAAGGVRLAQATRFTGVRPRADGGFSLRTRHGEHSRVIDADFVVDASGASAVFARAGGARRLEDRPLVCLGLRFAQGGAGPLTGLTHLEAVADGWWYGARLPEGRMLLTLTTDAETLKRGRFHLMEHWYRALEAAPNTAPLLGDATPIDPAPISFPAPSHRMSLVAGKRWLAVGDAAGAYDPITSQGIIKAVSGGLYAAEIIGRSLQGEADATAQYATQQTSAYRSYLAMRNHFYHQERRFSETPFWRHMHGEQPVAAMS